MKMKMFITSLKKLMANAMMISNKIQYLIWLQKVVLYLRFISRNKTNMNSHRTRKIYSKKVTLRRETVKHNSEIAEMKIIECSINLLR